MSNVVPQDLSNWTDQPFWTHSPVDGRVAYISYEDGRFEATGKIKGTQQVVFVAQGSVALHLSRFRDQMSREGARVVEVPGPFINKDTTVEPPPGQQGPGRGDELRSSKSR
jgi:hypothetical protein